MSTRNPNIGIHRHPLALADEPARIKAARRGEVVHHALSTLGRRARSGRAVCPAEIEAAVAKAFAILDLDPGQWTIERDFTAPLSRLFTLPEIKAWFEAALPGLEEAEIVTIEGAVCRPDRIVLKNGRVEVIDFKVGKREDAHQAQIRSYMDLLAAAFDQAPVAGYLVYIDEAAVVEVK